MKTSTCWVLVLALWSFAAHAENEVETLIGWEYPPPLDNGLVHPEIGCRSRGGGPIEVRDVRQRGWSFAQLDCDDKVVFTLERSTHRPDGSISRLKVIDAFMIPGASYNRERNRDAPMYAEDGTCALDGKYGTTFFAKVVWGKRTRLDWRHGVLAAWTYDTKQGKIVPLSTKRVTCIEQEP